MLGDCLERMKEIPDCSIDLTVTSPPYDNLRTYNNTLEWGEHIWKPVLQELFRVTKQGCVVVWIVGDATIKGSETGSSFKQALFAMECGFNLHDTMIWEKIPVPFDPKCSRYWQTFEYMFIFSKGKPQCNYIKVPCKHSGKTKSDDYGQRYPDAALRLDRRSKNRVVKADKVKANIWFFNQAKGFKGHPATFPEDLVHDHIISWSTQYEVVLDPFMGSGTTGVVCKNLNRSFIGIEKDETYFKIAQERISVI